MTPTKRTIRASQTMTTTTTHVTNAQLKALIDQGFVDALTVRDADRTLNEDDSYNSGTGSRRTKRTAHERWRLSSISVPVQSKTKLSLLLEPFMMNAKYCPRNEIKKLEMEIWELKVKVKGIDLTSYTQRFQELALMCGRMFFEESDKIENTILENESDEFIKSSVEDLVPITSESEDTSRSDSAYDLPSCDDFSPIDIPEGKSVIFSNPLFDSNDDFTFSNYESLSDEDVPEDNVKINLNPLFEFDDEYISSDVNPLFDEVLENIKNKDSYDFNLDEPDLLVTPLSDASEDECFDLGDDVDESELLLHHDPSTLNIIIASILEGFTNESPLEENDDLFDLESKENEWKKILYDAPIDDLMTEEKVLDLEIWMKIFSPTYVRLPFEDRHYLSLTYVI
nr:reverse transcriptase domain-containing protein [Tanacetum cinerariifolium]